MNKNLKLDWRLNCQPFLHNHEAFYAFFFRPQAASIIIKKKKEKTHAHNNTKIKAEKSS
jgi:hypothetical protein